MPLRFSAQVTSLLQSNAVGFGLEYGGFARQT